MNYHIETVALGPCGVLHYREGPDIHTFDWEYGGGDVVLCVYVPAPTAWDAAVPWAAGRRAEILERIGRKLSRRLYPFGTFVIEDRWIYVSEARPPWRVVGGWLKRFLSR